MSATETPELHFKPAGSEQATLRPWPRYFARMLDVIVLSAVLMFALAIIGMIVAPEATMRFSALLESGFAAKFLSNVIGIALALPPIALLLAYGQTPGKWLFGIRVRKHDGDRMGWRTALHREFLVWAKGLGLGIPVVTLIALFTSHSALTDHGVTSWDKQLQCRVTHAPATTFWWVRAILGGVIVIAATFYGAFSMVFDL